MAKTIATPVVDLIDISSINIPKPVQRAKPDVLVPFILDAEGGLSEAKTDAASGNYCPTPLDGRYYHTNKGITYTTWVNVFGNNRDQAFLNMKHSDWMQVFIQLYWSRWKADYIYSQEVANILVDWVWASGVWGIRFPQRMLGVMDDGIVGDKTLTSLNKQNKDEFLKRLYARREEHFRNLAAKDPKFGAPNLQGWLNRLENLKKFNERIKRE